MYWKIQLLGEDERKKCVAGVNYSAFERLLIFLRVLSLPAMCRKVSYLLLLLLLLAEFFFFFFVQYAHDWCCFHCSQLWQAHYRRELKKKKIFNAFLFHTVLFWWKRSSEGMASVQRAMRARKSIKFFVLIDVSW